MKYRPGEDIDSWANRVKMYEQGHALQRIAQGEDVDRVMEDMARRIVEKMMYPIIKSIKDSPTTDTKYEGTGRSMGEIPTGVADHVVDDK
jgi:glutamyl-tRNA reductase